MGIPFRDTWVHWFVSGDDMNTTEELIALIMLFMVAVSIGLIAYHTRPHA